MPGPHDQRGSVSLAGAVQTEPHAPQFSLSESSLTQSSPHCVKPLGHPHAPLQQTTPSAHTFPHAPQFAGSLRTEVSQPSLSRPLQSA